MPSEKILSQKKQTVAQLTDKMKNAVAGVLVDYKGITVTDDTKLRKELREAGVEYSVEKNTMLRFAAKEVGYEALNDVLKGTTALAISNSDEVAAAKVLTKYAEKGKFVIKAGFVDGGVIDAAKVAELGKLPSREDLLSMLCSALQGNIRGLAVALNAIAEKNDEGEAAPAEEAPAAE
jgi:large subunit ribosomal protein L10